MKARIAALVMALAATGGGVAAAGPGDREGFACLANPLGSPPPFTCQYVAKWDGMWEAEGTWTLVIKRGCDKRVVKCKQTITIDSASYPGGAGYGAPGSIKAGDRVTGTFKALGTFVAAGNYTGG